MGRAPKIFGAQMVNTNQGVDPNIARQFQTPFNANQLQGGGNAFNLGGRRCPQQTMSIKPRCEPHISRVYPVFKHQVCLSHLSPNPSCLKLGGDESSALYAVLHTPVWCRHCWAARKLQSAEYTAGSKVGLVNLECARCLLSCACLVSSLWLCTLSFEPGRRIPAGWCSLQSRHSVECPAALLHHSPA